MAIPEVSEVGFRWEAYGMQQDLFRTMIPTALLGGLALQFSRLQRYLPELRLTVEGSTAVELIISPQPDEDGRLDMTINCAIEGGRYGLS